MKRYGYKSQVIHDKNTGHGYVETKTVEQAEGKLVMYDDAMLEIKRAELRGRARALIAYTGVSDVFGKQPMFEGLEDVDLTDCGLNEAELNALKLITDGKLHEEVKG